jgi:hypothetical protein
MPRDFLPRQEAARATDEMQNENGVSQLKIMKESSTTVHFTLPHLPLPTTLVPLSFYY